MRSRRLFSFAFAAVVFGGCSANTASTIDSGHDASLDDGSATHDGSRDDGSAAMDANATHDARVGDDGSRPDGEAGVACPGTPPQICFPCCGRAGPATCVNGQWTCEGTPASCAVCDAGLDGAPDASPDGAGACGHGGEACCPSADGGAPGCLDAWYTCCPSGVCLNGGHCADVDAGVACGAKDDAGAEQAGTCPAGEFCCNQSHSGATGFVCKADGDPCPPVP